MGKKSFDWACREFRIIAKSILHYEFDQAAHDLHWLFELTSSDERLALIIAFTNWKRDNVSFLIFDSCDAVMILDGNNHTTTLFSIDTDACTYSLFEFEACVYVLKDIQYDCGIPHGG